MIKQGIREGAKFMGNLGRVYLQGGRHFFGKKKKGERTFFRHKKGGQVFFYLEKRGATFFFWRKKGGQEVFFGTLKWGVNTFFGWKKGGQWLFSHKKKTGQAFFVEFQINWNWFNFPVSHYTFPIFILYRFFAPNRPLLVPILLCIALNWAKRNEAKRQDGGKHM